MDVTDNEEELVIDTSPTAKSRNKYKTRSRKRKRISSTSSSEFVLTSNTFELEKSLQASALKNNLDDTSVKKIIKKVVTNDHVLALVKLREEEEEASSTDEDVSTLTRSKAKTVKRVPRVTAPWNLQLEPIEHIPVKTRPEVEALIAQELHEDEDDEEYEPTNDDIPSDDDHIESCSDLDSQPRTPATPRRTQDSPRVLKDGPFKVPQDISKVSRQLNLEEEATIALRTRSKLSLSSTPIEHIESSFVPPDDLPQTDVDEIWNDFLKECLDPASNAKHEDDDDADPEYNVAADTDAVEDESLENSIIKISKKELEDILTELCQVMPAPPEKDIQNTQGTQPTPDTKDTQVAHIAKDIGHWDGKREIPSDDEQPAPVFERRSSRLSIGKTEPLDDDEQLMDVNSVRQGKDNTLMPGEAPTALHKPMDVTMAMEEEVAQLLGGGDTPAVVKIVNTPRELVVNIDGSVQFLPEQRLLLEQQLRQHIQLSTTHFMQVCVNPKHWHRATTYREYLESLNKIADSNPSSVVNVCNLRPALELVNAYETAVTDVTPENEWMVKFIAEEMEKMSSRTSNKRTYRGNFPDTFKRVVAGSNVFLYPYLLPPSPFRPHATRRFSYLRSEDEYIALGLEQFFSYVESNPDMFLLRRLPGRRGLQAATALVCRHMMPWLQPQGLASHISLVRKAKDTSNPIYKFIKNRYIEPVKHKLLPFDPTRNLYQQPEHEMPRSWVAYLAKADRRFRSYLYKRTHVNGSAPAGVEIDSSKILSNYPKTPISLPIDPVRTRNRVNAVEEKEEEVIVTTTPTLTVATRVYNLVTTSNGIVLVPQPTPTVATSVVNTPICSVVEQPQTITQPQHTITIDSGRLVSNEKITKDSVSYVKIAEKPAMEVNKEIVENQELHCKCCELLRKIRKTRQTLITDFIRGSKTKRCPCQSVTYPRITNKLRLLIRYYASFSKTVYSNLKRRLQELKVINGTIRNDENDGSANKEQDAAFVISFIMKLTIRMNMSKAQYAKQRIDEILQAFDTNTDNPLYLAANLYKFLGTDEIDLYREFMAFLAPDQADRLDKFKDYFINNCMEDYMKKVEECIPNEAHRCVVTEKLLSMFGKTAMSSCDCCCGLLETVRDYPTLAEHTFYLFPHRRKERDNFYKNSTFTNKDMDCDMDKEATNDNSVNNAETPKIINNKATTIVNTNPLSKTPNIKPATIVNNNPLIKTPKIINIQPNINPATIVNTNLHSESPKLISIKPNINPATIVNTNLHSESPKLISIKPNINPATIVNTNPLGKTPKVINIKPNINPATIVDTNPLNKTPKVINIKPNIKAASIVNTNLHSESPKLISIKPNINPATIVNTNLHSESPKLINIKPNINPATIVNTNLHSESPKLISIKPKINPATIVNTNLHSESPKLISIKPNINPVTIVNTNPLSKSLKLINIKPNIKAATIVNSDPHIKTPKIIDIKPNINPTTIVKTNPHSTSLNTVSIKPHSTLPRIVNIEPHSKPKIDNRKPNRNKKSSNTHNNEEGTSSNEEEANMSISENASATEADEDESQTKGQEPERADLEERESPEEQPLSKVKEEPSDVYEITYTTTEVQHRDDNEKLDKPVIESEVNVKIEPLEWKREEDKSLLELMKKSLADGKIKTIYDIVESQSEKFLKCCENKSLIDITNRLFDLLQVVNES